MNKIVAEVRAMWEDDGYFFALREYDPDTKLPKFDFTHIYKASKKLQSEIYPDMLDDIYWFDLEFNAHKHKYEIIEFYFEADSLEQW